MTHEEDHIITADGLRLHVSRWLPERPAKAAVVLVHGFAEHSGRYAELAQRLNQHGYAVYAADLRGHGRSEGEPILVMDFDHYVDDLSQLLKHVRAPEPDRPLFLFGHSMGGTIVALLAVTGHRHVRGVALSAPAVRISANVYPILRRLAHVLGRWFPRVRVVRLGNGMLSRDEEVVQQFHTDPLVYHGRMPSRTGSEILRATERLRRRAFQTRLPLLILHGTADRLTAAEGSRELFGSVSSTDKTLKLYEGLYHDLVHEPEKEIVMGDLVAWLEGRMRDEDGTAKDA